MHFLIFFVQKSFDQKLIYCCNKFDYLGSIVYFSCCCLLFWCCSATCPTKSEEDLKQLVFFDFTQWRYSELMANFRHWVGGRLYLASVRIKSIEGSIENIMVFVAIMLQWWITVVHVPLPYQL